MVSIVLIFLVSTRTEVGGGPDYSDYYYYFYNGAATIDKEIGYSLLNKIIYRIFNDFNIFMIIVGILIVGGRIIYIYRYSPLMLISLLTYYSGNYLTYDFDVFRQGIALSIILVFSMKYLEQDNIKYFIISVIIATSFHLSAIVFVLAYFMKKIKINRKIYFISVSVAIIFGITNIISIPLSILKYIPYERVQLKYYQYLANAQGLSALNIGFFVDLILVILLMITYNNLKDKYKLPTKLFLLAFVGQCLLIRYPSGRLLLYFTFSKVVLFSVVLCEWKSIFIKYSYTVAIIGYSVLKFISSYNSPTNAIEYYKSFFFK